MRLLNQKEIFLKKEMINGKTSFVVRGSFCTPHSIFAKLTSERAVLYGKIALSILIPRVCVFREIWFNVKVLKTFKISSDCRIETCRSLNRRSILKIPSTAFQKNLCSFCWFQNKISKKKRFHVLRQKPAQVLS